MYFMALAHIQCEGGGVLARLSGFNPGRGHCRDRICIHRAQGESALGSVLIGVIPSSR